MEIGSINNSSTIKRGRSPTAQGPVIRRSA
nr:MAG TPA: hypothetical protein [Caudoviricetes sp.]